MKGDFYYVGNGNKYFLHNKKGSAEWRSHFFYNHLDCETTHSFSCFYVIKNKKILMHIYKIIIS